MVATLVVALAVATMISLGLWQLRRLEGKEAQLARYAQAQRMSADMAWPRGPADYEGALYHHSTLDCLRVRTIDTTAGHAVSGETGWAHIARCEVAGGGTAEVALGWSREPKTPDWQGGSVAGFIGPYRGGVKLVVTPPQAGLEQLALPDPRDVPNNHLSYAVQWFLFALTALVIYVLALRKKWRTSGD